MGTPKIVRILDAILGQMAFKECFVKREQGWLDPFRMPELPAMGLWYDRDGEDDEADEQEVHNELQRVASCQVLVMARVRAGQNQNSAIARLIKLVQDTLAHDPGLGGLIDKPIEFDEWDNFPFPDKPEESAVVGSTVAFEVKYHVERGNF